MTIQTNELPLKSLIPWKGNPRKNPAAETIVELSESIRANGILENLVVRKAKKNGAFEVICGNRRYLAADVVTASGELGAFDPERIPVKILDIADREALLLAIVENVQREDLTPLEEAEAFQTLIKVGGTTEAIAAAVGKSRRHVQLRLALVDKLSDPTRKALTEGRITLAMARVLTAVDAERQASSIQKIENNWFDDAEHLKADLLGDNPPAQDWPLFDLALYKGDFIEDPDDPQIRYFADIGQAEKLQMTAIEAYIKAERSGDHAFVKVYYRQKNEYYYSSNFDKAKKGQPAGIAIIVSRALTLEIDEGLTIKKKDTDDGASAKAGDKSAEPKKLAEPCTKKHYFHARRRKSEVLQKAVAKDPTVGKALAILGLMGGDAVRINRGPPASEDLGTSSAVAVALDRFRAKFPKLLLAAGTGWQSENDDCPFAVKDDDKSEVAVLNILIKMKDDELDKLLAALTARHVGSFNDWGGAGGDDAVPLFLAEVLKIKGNEEKHGLFIKDKDLEGLRKPGLETIAAELKIEPGKTLKATREKIAEISGTYIPPALRFGTPTEIAKALRKPQAKPAAKKKEGRS